MIAAIVLAGLPLFPLHEPDEGRYADIASSMLRTGDWVTPHLDGIAYFEKPPLVFWLAGASMGVFGLTPFAARLPSALACIAVLLLLVRWGRLAFGRTTASLAPLLFGTLPLVFLLSRALLVDFVLTAATTLALYAAWQGLVRPERERRAPRAPILLFWLATGLAFLAKGPVGLALPGAAIGAYLLLSWDWRRIGALLRPDGLLVFIAVIAPWYAAMAARHPNFLYDFFVEQNVERLTSGGRFDRQEATWFYLPVLLVGCLPWVGGLPSALARVVQGRAALPTTSEGRTRIFLACAVIAPLMLLSVAQSKLWYYVLPLMPPLALLLADDLVLRFVPRPGAEVAGGRRASIAFALGGLLLLAGAGAALYPMLADDVLARLAERVPEALRGESVRPELLDTLLGLLLRLALVLATAGGLLLVTARIVRRSRFDAVLSASSGMLVLSLGLAWIVAAAGPVYSAQPVAQLVLDHARPGEPVVAFGRYARGVPYYLQRPVALWYASKAEFGQTIDDDELPELAFQRRPEALQRFVAERDSVLVMVNGSDDRDKLDRILTQAPTVLGATAAVTLLRYER